MPVALLMLRRSNIIGLIIIVSSGPLYMYIIAALFTIKMHVDGKTP